MKAIYFVVCLLLLSAAVAGDVANGPKLRKNKLPKVGERNADNIYNFVDHGLREKYWYYLTKACLIYVAAIERGDSYQYLAIYRNIVGTFLAITSWKKQASSFDVNTLVRLGNGYGKDSGANYKPVELGLAHFRYSLGTGQYLIDVSDCGDVKLNGKVLSDNLNDNLKKEHNHGSEDDLVAKCKNFHEYTKKKFWYYLDEAKVIYSSVGSTVERSYCLVAYLNVAGTFFVLGSDDHQSHTCSVNTFVRAGNGFDQDSEATYGATEFEKATLPLEDYED